MTDRRSFLLGCLAASAVPHATWAATGATAFLSAGKIGEDYVLCGLSRAGDVTFEIPIPTRGHAAAAHPTRPEAVAFARRPGTFAMVLDCATGDVIANLSAARGRHFYGHGVFSQEGRTLFTTENDYDAARGVVGVWDTATYTRIDEFDSGGVGPHDIKRLPNSGTLVVANGGIETHPDSGRDKLNIPVMESNLAYLENGTVTETVTLGRTHQYASIRHLSVARDGTVTFGMQWEGGTPSPALVGTHLSGNAPALMSLSDTDLAAMSGYVASIAFSGDDRFVGVTCPRGGLVQTYDTHTGRLAVTHPADDIGGIAAQANGFTVTSGDGSLLTIGAKTITRQAQHSIQWDNHLVAV